MTWLPQIADTTQGLQEDVLRQILGPIGTDGGEQDAVDDALVAPIQVAEGRTIAAGRLANETDLDRIRGRTLVRYELCRGPIVGGLVQLRDGRSPRAPVYPGRVGIPLGVKDGAPGGSLSGKQPQAFEQGGAVATIAIRLPGGDPVDPPKRPLP